MTTGMTPPFMTQQASAANAINILLIEDNPGDARLVEILLLESDFSDFKITNKVTLSEGLEALSNNDYDVVLLDLTLPDSRGFETLEKLIDETPEVNVIVMTGLADKALGLKAVQKGAQDFLMKGGFDSDMLSKTLRYAIERKNVLVKLAAATRARDVAEESARMKEHFIANISHEMRTPMNAILGMSNLLAQTNLSGEQSEFVGSIKQSSEILLGVINDILEISTIQNGKMAFERKDFDLHEVMTNLINVMQYKRAEKNLEFQLHLDPRVPQIVSGDKLRINQVLFNIAGNSVKFTDSGFIRISVHLLENDERMHWLRFEIEDSGIGIPSNKLDAIFETFTRIISKERLFEGTGLGLSIVKNLVVSQGGRVWAESTLGKGSTFFVEIPLFKAEGTIEEVADENHSSNNDNDRTFNLLLVEDHKMNQIVAKKTIEKQFPNVKMTIANHGGEAVELLTANPKAYDVILLDIQMPVMDGNETVAYIHNKLPEVTAPVLAMTAHAYISKDEIYKSYGFDDFVLKPFEPEQLFSKIHLYLNKINKK